MRLPLIFISIILLSNIVGGATLDGIDYTSGSSINNALANGETVDWNQVTPDMQSQINPEHISKIPANKVDVTKVKDQSKLTADQLVYNKNLDKLDASKLNQQAYAEALKRLGRAKDIKTQATQPTTTTSYDDGFDIDSIYLATIDGVSVVNGEGISYRNNVLSVKKANTIRIQDGVLSNVENFEGTPIQFSVDSAQTLFNKCVTAKELKDTSVSISQNAIEFQANNNVAYEITDCGSAQVTFESNNGSVILNKQVPTTYNLKNGSLTRQGDNYTEKIDANNSAAVVIDVRLGV